MNKLIIFGNLGADPESRTTQGGTEVCNLRVAVNERRKVQGEWTDHTEWFRVAAFGRTAENCQRFLTKGSKVLIEGRISTREYTDKEGIKRWSTEVLADRVTFGGGRGDGAGSGGGGGYGSGGGGATNYGGKAEGDIPFAECCNDEPEWVRRLL